MPPLATIVDSLHVCPMVTVIVPHVGGPVTGPGAPTVLADCLPTSVEGDLCVCVGPPDTVALGFPTVMAEGRPVSVVGISMSGHAGDVAGPGAVTIEVG